MKKAALIFLMVTIASITTAQEKKLVTEINSLITKEKISFKYNNKNQLIYFDEQGAVTYREFTLKYDKKDNTLIECIENQDRGELIQQSKYIYTNADYISSETKNSGRKLREKFTENENIYTDTKGRLLKTVFADGKIWEEFAYDNNNNILKYTLHSATGKNDVVTTFRYNDKISIFSNISDLPLWFWTLHMNNMRWCTDFTGNNIPTESKKIDPRLGTDNVSITYNFDTDGYPVKQYYDGELVREFSYKSIK